MHWVRLDRDCTFYATFQSHNQKVVQNRRGIFLSYLSRYEEGENGDGWKSRGRWRLMRSTDGGDSFQPILDREIVGNKPPCMETDENDNLMLAGEDGTDRENAHYYLRLSAEGDSRSPDIARLPHQVLGKFATAFDANTRQLCFFDHYGWLYLIDAATGAFRQVKVMLQEGANAYTQYPHVYLDRSRVLHHAWTTQKKNKDLYWTIHYARSDDLGRSWKKADGTPLPGPFIPDDGGPTDQIVLPDELDIHTWLSSMIEKNGRVHFAYRAHNYDAGMNRQHYVRIDLKDGKIDRNVHPEWRIGNVSINSLDGFFATRREEPASPLCYVSRTTNRELAAIVSEDNGDTWSVLEVSDPLPIGKDFYSIGGCRELTRDGFILGTFTAQEGRKGDPYFFRIPVRG